MASVVSPWTKKGSNTNAAAVGADAQYLNPGDNGALEVYTRYECTLWLEDEDEFFTKPFDFPVQGDLTICVNPTKVALDGDQDSCTLKMYGSVTGESTHYVEMKSIDTGMDIDEEVYVAVYDFDESGRLPFMKLGVTQENALLSNNTDNPFKIVVVPH